MYVVLVKFDFPFGTVSGFAQFGPGSHPFIKLGDAQSATQFNNRQQAEDCAVYAMAEIASQVVTLQVVIDYEVL